MGAPGFRRDIGLAATLWPAICLKVRYFHTCPVDRQASRAAIALKPPPGFKNEA